MKDTVFSTKLKVQSTMYKVQGKAQRQTAKDFYNNESPAENASRTEI